MIVGKQKPIDEIWESIKAYKKVLVFGCNTCVAVCHEGGNKEAEILASLLRMRSKQEDTEMDVQSSGIERQCEHEFFESAKKELEWADAVLTLACGVGVQTLAKLFPDMPVFPAQNTHFMGAEEREEGIMEVRCAGCGDCVLALTGGICPVARCAKGLLNGPCGGSENGKCEVDPERDCAWALIYEQLKRQGKLQLLEEIRPPKDYHLSGWKVTP